MYEFLQQFFKANPQFQNSRFFVTGESYGGHYVPAVANRLWKGNEAKEGIQVNLQGIAVGNGFVNARLQYPEYVKFAKRNQLLNEDEVKFVKAETKACISALERQSKSALGLCNRIIDTTQKLGHRFNVYDIRKKVGF